MGNAKTTQTTHPDKKRVPFFNAGHHSTHNLTFFSSSQNIPTLQREEAEGTLPSFDLDNRPLSAKPAKFSLFGNKRLQLDPALSALRLRLAAKGKNAIWDNLLHTPLNLSVPPQLSLLAGAEFTHSKNAMVFGPIAEPQPMLTIMREAAPSIAKQIQQAQETNALSGTNLWLLYRNDGSPPFNPGGGSDQGPTAHLSIYLTFDNRTTGLTKLGLTAIDMHTPKPILPPGAPQSKESNYQTEEQGPFKGITSIDFEVTVLNDGTLKVSFPFSVGIDSAKWGKIVQDFIHKKVSDSPLFPWPDRDPKLYAQGGVSALLTPRKAVLRGDVYGVSYTGRLEYDAAFNTGTHHTDASAGARLVIRTAKMNTRLGAVNVEYSPIGVFAKAFVRYNDGREGHTIGLEGGIQKSLMFNIGRFGIGVYGKTTLSTDPALNTNLPAGAAPLLNPFPNVPGGNLGGPEGAHHEGGLMVRWTL